MRSSLAITALVGVATALPRIPFTTGLEVIPISEGPVAIAARQNGAACFVIGKEKLPEETAGIVTELTNKVTCSTSVKTLSNVPDVTSGSQTFSQIDFSKSGKSPLEFALGLFATADNLADSNLAAFQDALAVYHATEAGIRSVGGNLAIKVPKFFLQMQISRIQTAQGNPPTAAGLQVDHLRDKVLTNGAGEDKALRDQVTALAAQVS